MDQEIDVYKAANNMIEEGFKSAGITEKKPFEVLSRLLDAKKTTLDKYGREHYEDDNNAQGKAVELTLRLMRLLDNKVAEIKTQTVNINLTPEYVDKLSRMIKEYSGLKQQLDQDPVHRGRVIDVESV